MRSQLSLNWQQPFMDLLKLDRTLVNVGAQRNITADVELIRPDQINAAYQRILDKDIRYRFVIDFT